jgi:DGQHR domain-containing protein
MYRLECCTGKSAGRRVLLGFAPARLLKELSWADVLDEESGRGYQRRFNSAHSLDFRRYIHEAGSTTIPLTFNLRAGTEGSWRIIQLDARNAVLEVDAAAGRILSQVDCQHRLGHLADSDIELPFMCFQGLTVEEETEIFGVINGKAKGLSRSLLDYQEAQLCEDVKQERPELFISLCLANDPASAWFRALDFGGASTSGMKRRASLRTMQKAVRRFLAKSHVLEVYSTDEIAKIVLDFWIAVATVLPTPWQRPRSHLVSKGVGVYALMEIAADLVLEAEAKPSKAEFTAELSDFLVALDWSSTGSFAGLGGEKGAATAAKILRDARRRSKLKVVQNG